MPAGVCAGTLTIPVSGSSNGTFAPIYTGVAGVKTVMVTAERLVDDPLSKSLLSALPTLVLLVYPLVGP